MINPDTEDELRGLIDHAMKRDLDDVARVMVDMGEAAYRDALGLLVNVSAYIVIDVSERYPADVDLREISRIATEAVSKLPVTEDEIYAFLLRSVFGGEPLDRVFTDETKIGSVPVFAVANMLLSFTPKGKHWPDYLDVIESAIEASEKLSMSVLPSLLYRHQVANGGGRPSTL